MSLTPESRRKVIDYYFEEPNAKAVVEDGLGSNIQDVRDFLKVIYELLVKWHEMRPVYKEPSVPMGRGATTADLERLKKARENK